MAPTYMNASHYIPDDVVVSTILPKLPIKSLKRFTCVCKSWALLFENVRFMKMFSNSLISRDHSLYDGTCLLVNQMVGPNFQRGLYLISGEKFENKVKLDRPPQFDLVEGDCGIHILGSAINGTICLYQGDHTKSLLWNPATKEVKVIPPSLAENIPNFTTGFTLHGFGYDYVRDDYIIIQYVYYFLLPINFEYFEDDEDDPENDGLMRPEPFWEIYSLKSNSWRRLDVDMPTRYLSFECAEVYLNGVCHWWGRTNDETYIVSFNLRNEVFFTTPLHFDMYDGYDNERVERHLVVLNCYVAMISNYVNTTSFHISVLGEPGIKESWFNLYHFGPLSCIEFPIGTGKKGDIFFKKEDDKLACFDLITREIKEVGLEIPCHCCQIVVYKKNLLPIEEINKVYEYGY